MRQAVVDRALQAGKHFWRVYASDEAFRGAVPVAVVLILLVVTLWITQLIDAYAASTPTPVVPDSLPGSRRVSPSTHWPALPTLLARESGVSRPGRPIDGETEWAALEVKMEPPIRDVSGHTVQGDHMLMFEDES